MIIHRYQDIIEYLDTNESDDSLIALSLKNLEEKNNHYTHIEIHPTLMLGVIGN